MSPADPDDRDDPAGYSAESAAVSAAFEDIVAGWRTEGDVPVWPADPMPDDRRRSTPTPPELDRPTPAPEERSPPPTADDASPSGWDQAAQPPSPPRPYAPLSSDDDHFVPPEPPPLPRIGRAAAVGMGLIAIGLTFLLAPGLLGVAESVGLTLGLLTVAGGLGWLVLGSWAGDPPADPYDPDDDGAVF